MIWLALFVAVVVAVLTAAAVLGRVDGSLADATSSMSHVPLPEDQLTPDDIDELRFDTALRGYRMSQVDAVIDRLRREIGDLDDELARAHQAYGALAASSKADGERNLEPVPQRATQPTTHPAPQSASQTATEALSEPEAERA